MENTLNSISFIGMSGCGKSTIGKQLHYELSKFFNIDFKDFDDDILEKISLEKAEELIGMLKLASHGITPEDLSNQTVAHILKILGDEDFGLLENAIGSDLDIYNNPTILSTSGSLVLQESAMDNIASNSIIVHINTNINTILKRAEIMKVDRIIGMSEGKTFEDILNYRKKFYQQYAEFSFTPNDSNHIETTNPKIIKKQQSEIFEQFLDFFKDEIKPQLKFPY